MPVISDLHSPEFGALTGGTSCNAPKLCTSLAASVKEGTKWSGIQIVRSIDPYNGKPIFMRIGQPMLRIAPVSTMTREALRLVTGTGRVCLDDLFPPSGRSSAIRRDTKSW